MILIGESTKMLRTSEEWQKLVQAIYPDYMILDPDGWDRTNYQYSWHEELISQEEFEKRAGRSTCQWPNKMLQDIISDEFKYA